MSNKRPLYIPIAGPALLETSLLNKGSAFSSEERDSFNLTGLLPHNIETIEEQSLRAYHQLRSFTNTMDKHIYLRRHGPAQRRPTKQRGRRCTKGRDPSQEPWASLRPRRQYLGISQPCRGDRRGA